MRSLALAIALFAALPVFGGEPVQVQLDVTIISGPNSMLGHPVIKALLPKESQFAGVIESADGPRLVEAARDKCGAKLLAEPKLVTLSGRPAHFLSGGQTPVTSPGGVTFQNVGAELSLLPIAMNGLERIYLECAPVTRRVALDGTLDERSLRAAVELKIGQSMIVCQGDLPASKTDFGPPALSKIPYTKRLFSARGESEAMIFCVTPTIVAQRPAALPIVPLCPAALPTAVDQGKNVAAMLAREYQQACEANNPDLASKLARMALELDPMCFKTAPPAPAPTTERANEPKTETTLPSGYFLGDHKPQYFRPDPDFPLEKELATQQGYDRLAIGAPKCQHDPSEQEVLAALNRDRQVSIESDNVEITFEKLVDRLDPPRYFPLVGQAQLHHRHWKCTVYYTESIGMNWPLKISFKLHRTAVVYIDKDRLTFGPGDSRRTHRESGIRRTILLVDGQWRELQLFNELPDVNPCWSTIDDRILPRIDF